MNTDKFYVIMNSPCKSHGLEMMTLTEFKARYSDRSRSEKERIIKMIVQVWRDTQ